MKRTRSDKSDAVVSLSVTSNAALKKQRFQYQLKLLELTEMLHRKLDLERLLECFFIEVQSLVKFDGLEFFKSGSTLSVLTGNPRQHVVKVTLELGDEPIGDLSCYRSARFTAREEREISRLSSHILYPLRNALEYRAAVQKTLVDELTGMHNLLALDQCLPREILLARRSDIPLSVMMLDIDHFSAVNDHHGEINSDEALKSVAMALSKTIRKSDMIFRYDTDTFIVLLSGTEYAGAKVLAERIRKTVESGFKYDNIQIMMSASAGITELHEQDDAESVLERANEALSQAKNEGRNTLRAVDRATVSLSLV